MTYAPTTSVFFAAGPRRVPDAELRPRKGRKIACKWRGQLTNGNKHFGILRTASKMEFSASTKAEVSTVSKFRVWSGSPGKFRRRKIRWDGRARGKGKNSSNLSGGGMQACRNVVRVNHRRSSQPLSIVLICHSFIGFCVLYAIANSTAELGVHGRTYEATPSDAHISFSRFQGRSLHLSRVELHVR